MNKIITVILVITYMAITPVAAEPLSFNADDDFQSILTAKNGSRVTVKLVSGSELTGKVGTVNDGYVQIMELSGKEFFDAVISLDKIEALVIRTRK